MEEKKVINNYIYNIFCSKCEEVSDEKEREVCVCDTVAKQMDNGTGTSSSETTTNSSGRLTLDGCREYLR